MDHPHDLEHGVGLLGPAAFFVLVLVHRDEVEAVEVPRVLPRELPAAEAHVKPVQNDGPDSRRGLLRIRWRPFRILGWMTCIEIWQIKMNK